jgi:hypothetical protein
MTAIDSPSSAPISRARSAAAYRTTISTKLKLIQTILYLILFCYNSDDTKAHNFCILDTDRAYGEYCYKMHKIEKMNLPKPPTPTIEIQSFGRACEAFKDLYMDTPAQ